MTQDLIDALQSLSVTDLETTWVERLLQDSAARLDQAATPVSGSQTRHPLATATPEAVTTLGRP